MAFVAELTGFPGSPLRWTGQNLNSIADGNLAFFDDPQEKAAQALSFSMRRSGHLQRAVADALAEFGAAGVGQRGYLQQSGAEPQPGARG